MSPPATPVVRTPLRAAACSGVQTTAARTAEPTGGRPAQRGAAAQPIRLRRGPLGRLARFAALELGIWAALYGAYLAVRSFTIADAGDAVANAWQLVDLERALGIFHEDWLQAALGPISTFFSAYYMLAFGPAVIAVLVWLGLRRPTAYRNLRTALLVSIALASVLYVLVPTAPPRLVEGLGISDTVGLGGHDTGSFAGIRFNPYAAMPSMHVGWALLVGIHGFRSARRRAVRFVFALHPLLMALTVAATGNHYFVDALAGAGVALVALLLVRVVPRRPRRGGGIVVPFAARPPDAGEVELARHAA